VDLYGWEPGKPPRRGRRRQNSKKKIALWPPGRRAAGRKLLKNPISCEENWHLFGSWLGTFWARPEPQQHFWVCVKITLVFVWFCWHECHCYCFVMNCIYFATKHLIFSGPQQHVNRDIVFLKHITRILPEYCQNITRLLLQYYRDITIILSEYSQTIARILPDYGCNITLILPDYSQNITRILPDYCCKITKILPEYYQNIARILPDYYRIMAAPLPWYSHNITRIFKEYC